MVFGHHYGLFKFICGHARESVEHTPIKMLGKYVLFLKDTVYYYMTVVCVISVGLSEGQ